MPENVPLVATMVVEPVPTLVASPMVPAVLLSETTFAFDELQMTLLVTVALVPSEYVALAASCRLLPSTSELAAGVTVSAVTVTGGVAET